MHDRKGERAGVTRVCPLAEVIVGGPDSALAIYESRDAGSPVLTPVACSPFPHAAAGSMP
jgi:hypothetical protein